MFGRFGTPPAEETVAPKGFDDYDLRLGDIMRGERATMAKSLQDIERDLRIKAVYLAAIEEGNLSAFDAPSFIAGYVRSYARYLGLNGDESFAQFCRETGFVPAHGLSPAASNADVAALRAKNPENAGLIFASANAPRGAGGSFVEPGALGQLAVMIAVVCGLGYGGWAVLREVQKVQLAPIDQAPAIVADAPATLAAPAPSLAAIDPVAQAGSAALAPILPRLADETTAARAAQPQALDVPILIARDGPISAIDPRNSGALVAAAQTEEVQVVASPELVEVLAVRPSWISVTAADGTVLFEKILDAGERYAVPALEVAPRLKAGNSSAVYFLVGDQTYGPASTGPEVVRDVDLSVAGVQAAYSVADPNLDADLTAFVAEITTSPAPQTSE